MFSEKTLNKMSLQQVVSLSKNIALEIDMRLDDPYDAIDYVNALSFIVDNLRERLEAVTEDID